MRQIVKNVKGGKDVTFVCSKCGNVIYNTTVYDNNGYKPNWDKIPEKCTCGEKLTRKYPIVDADTQDMSNKDGRYNRRTYDDIDVQSQDNVNKKSLESRDSIKDLEGAISIDYFDMILNILKKRNIKIPENIDYLKMKCIERNISHIESSMGQLSFTRYVHGKKHVQERLNTLRQQYDDLSRKLEERKRCSNRKD